MLRSPCVSSRAALRRRLSETGRVQISDVLDPAWAEALGAAAAEADYNIVTRRSTGHLDLPRAWLESLTLPQRQGLGEAVQTSATDDFQYLLDSYPIHDLHGEGRAGRPWDALVDFLNGEEFLGLMREVTGEPRIAMADAQLTRFRHGHFLTSHDDEDRARKRHYAYVLNLSPRWRIDWGGLLAFEGADGNVVEAFTPRFNTLNLLRVPQPHSVTQVSLNAGEDRISVSGWLRGV